MNKRSFLKSAATLLGVGAVGKLPEASAAPLKENKFNCYLVESPAEQIKIEYKTKYPVEVIYNSGKRISKIFIK